MKSKFSIICGILIFILSFSNFSAFSKSQDPATYQKYYYKYVDSPEPLFVLENRDSQLYQLAWKHIIANPLTPSYTFTYGPHQLQKFDIYVHQGLKPAPVIFFIHSGYEDKIQVQVAVRQWMSLGYTVVSISCIN